jgi:hypothetical protein
MLFTEILIVAVFVAALLTAFACLTYLVYMTMLERRLLRSRRIPARASAWLGTEQTISPPLTPKVVPWGSGPGSPALPAPKR